MMVSQVVMVAGLGVELADATDDEQSSESGRSYYKLAPEARPLTARLLAA